MRYLVPLHIAVFVGGLVFGALCATAGADEGKDLFEKRCTGCHSLDTAKEGPRLRGVYGRRAGRSPDFPYSDALKAAQFTWDETTLDKWLTDTEALVAGNDMAFRVSNKDERAKIIAYLKELK